MCPNPPDSSVTQDAAPDAASPTDAAHEVDSNVESDAAGDAATDADAGSEVDCNGDHHVDVCAVDLPAKAAWGFDARCANPYRFRPFKQLRLNGIQWCEVSSHLTADGFPVMCCADGGEP